MFVGVGFRKEGPKPLIVSLVVWLKETPIVGRRRWGRTRYFVGFEHRQQILVRKITRFRFLYSRYWQGKKRKIGSR